MNFLFWVKLIGITLTIGTSALTVFSGAFIYTEHKLRGLNSSNLESRTNQAIGLSKLLDDVNDLSSLLNTPMGEPRSGRMIRDVRDSDKRNDDFYNCCTYWISDCEGMEVPKIVAQRGLDFNLHGAWNVTPGNDENYSQNSHIKCQLLESRSWLEALPFVLLGIRSAVKEDLGCSAAELVYGTPLALPGEFFAPLPTVTQTDFSRNLQQVIRYIKPRPTTTHGSKTVFVSEHLRTCSHVFLYNNADHAALHPVYLGPYPVRSRTDKYYDIEIQGKVKRVSIDRVKPCFLLTEAQSIPPQKAAVDARPENRTEDNILPPSTTIKTTRSGRHVRFPHHLQDYAPP